MTGSLFTFLLTFTAVWNDAIGFFLNFLVFFSMCLEKKLPRITLFDNTVWSLFDRDLTMWPFRGKRWEWQFFYSMYHVILFRKRNKKISVAFFFLSRTSWDNFIYLTCHKRCVAIRNQEVLQCICYCFVCLFFLIKMRFTINAYENSTQCDRFLFAIWPRDLFAGKDGSGSFLLNVSRDPFSQGNKTQRRFFFSQSSWDNLINLTCQRNVTFGNREVLHFFYCIVCFFFFFPLVEMSLKKNAYENSTQCDLFLIAILPCDLFAGNNGSGSLRFSTQCIRWSFFARKQNSASLFFSRGQRHRGTTW